MSSYSFQKIAIIVSSVFLLAIVIGSVFSPQLEFDQDVDVAGEYSGTDGSVKETLTISKDGTYHYQQFVGKASEVRENFGRWQSSYDVDRKTLSISVVGFRYFDASNLTVPLADVWFVDMQKDVAGRLFFCFDPDTSRCFRKSA